MSADSSLTSAVKALALEAGFARVGIAPADTPPQAERLLKWLELGWCGDMAFIRRNLRERLDPRSLLQGAQSVICLAVSYAPPPAADSRTLVARHARGRDYHRVLKARCLRMMDRLREIDTGFCGRAFVDSGPVMERSLAARAGVGWIGKNGCLIAPGLGSYVLLCEVISNLPLVPDGPIDDRCGDCAGCLSACPTGALGPDRLIDARRCVSYLTVECRGPIDRDLWARMGAIVFGCDRCQEACPHNRSAPPGDRELAAAGEPLGGMALGGILRWTEQDWDTATRGSACRRAKLGMLLRNAAIAAGNSSDRSLVEPLEDLSRNDPQHADVAQWAIERIMRTVPAR
jgi:epoxyqueuosine reductase